MKISATVFWPEKSTANICGWTGQIGAPQQWHSFGQCYLAFGIRRFNEMETVPLIEGRFHYWDEFIGSGPPPVKTRQGWLHIYHGVAGHFGSSNIYQAGVMLLDLNDPSKVLARSWCNILEPRELFELTGQVPNVVFPSGMIVKDFDAKVMQNRIAKYMYIMVQPTQA